VKNRKSEKITADFNLPNKKKVSKKVYIKSMS